MRTRAFWAALVAAGLGLGAFDEPKTSAPATPIQLNYLTGEITLGSDLAKLRLPADLRFLGPQDARKVLVDLWGNPPQDPPLGMILPLDIEPDQPESWAVVVTFEEEGFVEDKDADSIDYNALLKQMKEDSVQANEERKKAGFEPVELVGWATPPHYDKAAKKLYWAKDLRFGASADHTLNYNIRILGRRGVLVLNTVAAMSELKTVEAATPHILSAVEFNPGHRYADFVPGTDKLAAYGIGALIAGKVAAKAGLFKVILAFLLAAKKLVVVALVAIASFVKRLFSRGGDEQDKS